MNKYCGVIGFAEAYEDAVGVWKNQITEKTYYGDVIKNYRKRENAGVNDNINISNSISIIADPYANENLHNIIYATFMGSKWKVSDVEVQYPRLILTLGGVYN